MNAHTAKMLTGYLFPAPLLLLLLIAAVPGTAQASIKLKSEHTTTRMNCKECHHEYQQGYIPPPGVKITTRECSLCHMQGATKITRYADLPKITKVLHQRCIKCHEAFLLRGNDEKLRALLEMKPGEKGAGTNEGANRGQKKASQCMVCH